MGVRCLADPARVTQGQGLGLGQVLVWWKYHIALALGFGGSYTVIYSYYISLYFSLSPPRLSKFVDPTNNQIQSDMMNYG